MANYGGWEKTRFRTEKDIQSLLDEPVQEGHNIEYKRPDALRQRAQLAAQVCSFANASGGVLIYGIDAPEQDGVPTEIMPFEPDMNLQRLHDILNARVSPDFNYADFDLRTCPAQSQGESGHVLVVFVPESARAPHMVVSRDGQQYHGCYLTRAAVGIRRMLHWEVRDMMFRRQRPELVVEVRASESAPLRHSGSAGDQIVVTLRNDGHEVASDAVVAIHAPAETSLSPLVRDIVRGDYDPVEPNVVRWRVKAAVLPGLPESERFTLDVRERPECPKCLAYVDLVFEAYARLAEPRKFAATLYADLVGTGRRRKLTVSSQAAGIPFDAPTRPQYRPD